MENNTKQTVRYIEIGLENVEVITIDIENIEYMSIHGISECHSLPKIPRRNKEVDKTKRCQYLYIVINKNADEKYETFGGLSDLSVFERLTKFHDITDIAYLDVNKNRLESIYVPWKEKAALSAPGQRFLNGEDNSNQTSRIDRDNNLEIVVQGQEEW